MDVIADGRALEAFVKRRMEAIERPRSILELSRISGIRASTMYEWFSGARVPRTDSLARVGAALGVPTSRLLDAYERRASVDVNDAALAAIERAVERGVEEAIRQLIVDGLVSNRLERG